ncbi:hypothetical protein AVEN_120868-1 [Araneus ventricosus]|uniref:Uncharacterized protein n=1 Tax=Araneus ventricosus TaxID=182803 RepID=A0A4Y2K514_ARAVE|nr:hypothetical protein AVEN_120868-1 [Araneus ventricosus]
MTPIHAHPLPFCDFCSYQRDWVPLTHHLISALWPSGPNEYPNQMEIRLFPQSTPIFISFLHWRRDLASCVPKKVEWITDECLALELSDPHFVLYATPSRKRGRLKTIPTFTFQTISSTNVFLQPLWN